MNETDQDEEALKAAQDGRLYPVGRALRATFDADNHDTLGRDVTGLMIDLSHVPYPVEPRSGGTAPPPAADAMRDPALREQAARDRIARERTAAGAGAAGLRDRLARALRRIVPGGAARSDGQVRARP